MPQPRPNPRVRIDLVHEDPRVIVINKSPGVVTEPGRGHDHDSLLNGLVARFGSQLLRLGERRDYGLLHRLDRFTSGCVACALDADAYDRVRTRFETQEVDKRYLAIVRGRMPAGTRRFEHALGERRVAGPEGSQLVSVVSSAGKPAVTEIEVVATGSRHSLILCVPHTGRLHQIRVHLAHAGYPVEGDPLYGPGGKVRRAGGNDRALLGLHAWKLGFAHPDGARVDAVAPPSRKFLTLLQATGLELGPLRGPGSIVKDP